MSSSLPPNPTFSSERKCHGKASNLTAMALTLWILVVVIFVQSAQAGVIKKKEIPFTKDLTPEMAITTTTATNSAPTLGTVTTIRPTMHDPDIEEREATTLLSAPKIAAALAETRNNDSTRLELQHTADGSTADYSSSKQYMLNEIALNETKKMLKFVNDEQLLANKEETEIVLNNGTIQAVNNILEIITPKPNQEAGKDFDNSLHLKPAKALTLESASEPIVEKVAHETIINSQQDLKSTGNNKASEKNVNDVLSKVQIHNETISGLKTEHQTGSEVVGNGIALKGFENNPIGQLNLSEQNSADKEVTKSLTNAMESSANKSEPEINNLNNLLSKENSNKNKFQNSSETSLAKSELGNDEKSPNTAASSKISELGNDIVLNTENKSVSAENSKDVLQGNDSKEYQQAIQEIKTFLEASTKDNVQQSLQDLKPHMEISRESPIKEEQLHEAENGSQNILMNADKASKLNEETSKENLLHKMDDNKEIKNETLSIGPETTTIKSELGKDVTLHTVPNNSSLESSKDNVDVQTGYRGHNENENHQENDLVKTHNQTDVTVKDNSFETNHISDLTKATTEHSSESQQQSIFSTNANNTDNTIPSDSLQNKTDSTYGDMHVKDGLDKTVWKDVTNDLPEKTTETIPKKADTQIVDMNKVDYGRSMFKTETEAEAEETFTENVHIANNIDFGNASNSSIAGERGKKPKFINDNSTNAQQMNLPNNAEVWSLAGMKGLLALNSSAMETAQKHKEGERDSLVGAQLESPIINRTHLNSRPNTNSEKFLLDWSHIIMDKELSSTVKTTSYDEDGGNNEVRENIAGDSMTHKLLTEKPSTYELEGENKNSSEFSGTSSISTDTTTASKPITANSTTTILSLMSDKVLSEQGDKRNTTTDISAVNERVTLASPSQSSAAVGITSKEIELTGGGGGEGETSTLPAEIVASPKSVVTHEQLQQPDSNNEINLTLNKTLTAVDEFTAGEPDNSNRVTNLTDKDNETERVTVMTTAVIEESNAKTTSAAAVEEATAVSSSSSSTLDTGNENTTAADVNAATVLKNSQDIRENNESENPELLLNTTEFAITTFRPKFAGVTNNTRVDLDPTTVIGSTPITERNPLAEVNDQNGNNEIEQKQSINIESTTTPATTTTTTSSETSSFNNISSTIKTHLNEQVLLETTTELIITTSTPIPDIPLLTTTATKLVESESDLEATTTSETLSEKTTSSSKDNEIINEGIADIHLNETITTPKSLEENAREGEEEHQVEEEQVQTTTETVNIIGSATSSPTPLAETTKTETEQQQQEIETTTNFTESKQRETPVVAKTHEDTNLTLSQENNESLVTTTTTVLPEISPTTEEEETQEENKEKAKGEDTTTQVVDTYSEYPGQNKDIEKEPAVFTTTTETALESEATINENDKELETTTATNMSLISPSTTTTSTTIEPILNSTSKEEETFINLLDDSTTSAPSTTIANTEIPIITTSTTTTTTSSTTEATLKTTTKAPEEELLLTTTTRIPQRELPTTITNMIPTTTTTTTTPSPYIINGDMRGGADDKSSLTPTIDTILVGNSGNMFTKNTETASGGETDVNVIIAITVSVIGVIALILLVAFLYLMRKRQKQTSYSQRCRPVSLDEYTIDNGSIGGSIRKSSALRSSKRTYGNLAFDDPSIRHNALGVHELAKFASEKLRIFEEFRDVPQITAREDEVPQGCEDKNRYVLNELSRQLYFCTSFVDSS